MELAETYRSADGLFQSSAADTLCIQHFHPNALNYYDFQHPPHNFESFQTSTIEADHNSASKKRSIDFPDDLLYPQQSRAKRRNSQIRSWTPNEDQVLLQLVAKRGPKWAEIANILKNSFNINRLGKQCRERWCNHVNPNIRHDDWTKTEDEYILKLQSQMGNRWAKIAKLLNGRTENSVKNRFVSLLSKGARSRVTQNAEGIVDSDSTEDDESTQYVEATRDFNSEAAEKYVLENLSNSFLLPHPSSQSENTVAIHCQDQSSRDERLLYPLSTSTESSYSPDNSYWPHSLSMIESRIANKDFSTLSPEMLQLLTGSATLVNSINHTHNSEKNFDTHKINTINTSPYNQQLDWKFHNLIDPNGPLQQMAIWLPQSYTHYSIAGGEVVKGNQSGNRCSSADGLNIVDSQYFGYENRLNQYNMQQSFAQQMGVENILNFEQHQIYPMKKEVGQSCCVVAQHSNDAENNRNIHISTASSISLLQGNSADDQNAAEMPIGSNSDDAQPDNLSKSVITATKSTEIIKINNMKLEAITGDIKNMFTSGVTFYRYQRLAKRSKTSPPVHGSQFIIPSEGGDKH